MIRVALILLALLVLPGAAMAASQPVAWDMVEEPDLAGFRIYYGTASGMYTKTITILDPGARAYTITGLTDGVTYYCAATAFDTFGNESDYSNEISFVGGQSIIGALMYWSGGTFNLGTGGTILLQ